MTTFRAPLTVQDTGPLLAGQGPPSLPPPLVPCPRKPGVCPSSHLPLRPSPTRPQPVLGKSSAHQSPPSPSLAQPPGRNIYTRHYRSHTFQQTPSSKLPNVSMRPASKHHYQKHGPPKITASRHPKPITYHHPSPFRAEFRDLSPGARAKLRVPRMCVPCPGGTFPLRNPVPSAPVPVKTTTSPRSPTIPRTVRNHQHLPLPKHVRFQRRESSDAQRTLSYQYTHQWRIDAIERVALCVREFEEMIENQRQEFQDWLTQAQVLLQTLPF
ncbi:hypothetical protein E1B28_002707 [Marasmius oreades]|uniref:Uncharacterized protein n=1 Tax=Marasmius oreades TaxID=181124 RepID=A0A9P7UL36_9AGAR|nr:uncharacterized protein E1B28_002707 [Marasmius oreades]KAG7086777.1 hypothetical protein E1B28_002707 [Marasmius oreades]